MSCHFFPASAASRNDDRVAGRDISSRVVRVMAAYTLATLAVWKHLFPPLFLAFLTHVLVWITCSHAGEAKQQVTEQPAATSEPHKERPAVVCWRGRALAGQEAPWAWSSCSGMFMILSLLLQFLQQYRHYQSNVEIFKLQPDKANREMAELVMFLSQVTRVFAVRHHQHHRASV